MHQAIHFRKQYNWLRFYSITICVPFIHVHFSIDSIIFREMWDWIDLLWRVKQKQCDTLHINIIPYACAVYCYCASNMVSRQSLLSAMSRKMYISHTFDTDMHATSWSIRYSFTVYDSMFMRYKRLNERWKLNKLLKNLHSQRFLGNVPILQDAINKIFFLSYLTKYRYTYKISIFGQDMIWSANGTIESAPSIRGMKDGIVCVRYWNECCSGFEKFISYLYRKLNQRQQQTSKL